MNVLQNILKLSSAQKAGSQILRNANSSSILESIGSYRDHQLEVKKFRSKSLSPSNSNCAKNVIGDDKLVIKNSTSTLKTSCQRKKEPVTINISVSSRKYGTLQRFFDKFKFWKNTSASDDETATKNSTYPSKKDLYNNYRQESTTEEIEILKKLLKAEKLKAIIVPSEAAQSQTESAPIIEAKPLGIGTKVVNAALKNVKGREKLSIFATKKGKVCRTCGGRHGQSNENKQYFRKLVTEPKTSPSDNLQKVNVDSPSLRWKLNAENVDMYKFGKLVHEQSVRNPWTNSNPTKTPSNLSNQVENEMARFKNDRHGGNFAMLPKKQMPEQVIPPSPPSLSSITKPNVKKEIEQSRMILKLSPNAEFYKMTRSERSLQEFARPKPVQSRSRITHLSKFPFHCDSSCKRTAKIAKETTPATTHREGHNRKMHTKVGHLSESSMKRKEEDEPDQTDVKKTGPSLSGKQLVYRQLGIDKYKKSKSFIEGGKIIANSLRDMWTKRKR